MKLCKLCGCEKPIIDFKPNKICKDGYENTCRQCFRIRQRKWEERNLERHRENQLRWQSQNSEQYQQKKREWYERNKEVVFDKAKRYARENPGWKRSATAKRRTVKLNATAGWANQQKIRQIYEDANRLGLVVDHIIPLQHPLVCGLHVETNLQLLTASENSIKHNKFTIET